jgi:hypothetical protein
MLLFALCTFLGTAVLIALAGLAVMLPKETFPAR